MSSVFVVLVSLFSGMCYCVLCVVGRVFVLLFCVIVVCALCFFVSLCAFGLFLRLLLLFYWGVCPPLFVSLLLSLWLVFCVLGLFVVV